jgi:hypothetical protein
VAIKIEIKKELIYHFIPVLKFTLLPYSPNDMFLCLPWHDRGRTRYDHSKW